MVAEHEESSEKPPPRDASTERSGARRALAYHVAMAACVFLIAAVLIATGIWVVSPSGNIAQSLLMLFFFPGLFPVGFLCIVLYGYVSDYRSEQAKGTLSSPRYQLNLSHLLLIVFVAAILCAFAAFVLRFSSEGE
jgi:hypothetical protein